MMSLLATEFDNHMMGWSGMGLFALTLFGIIIAQLQGLKNSRKEEIKTSIAEVIDEKEKAEKQKTLAFSPYPIEVKAPIRHATWEEHVDLRTRVAHLEAKIDSNKTEVLTSISDHAEGTHRRIDTIISEVGELTGQITQLTERLRNP